MTFLPDLLPQLGRGATFTVLVTCGAALVALAAGFAAGLAQLSRLRSIRILATVYVEVFRGSSAVVQLFFFFYVLPLVGVTLGPLSVGVLALGLNEGAYVSQVVRGAITNVDRGQRDAAVALGLSPFHAMTRIVLPQALVAMLPPFGNQIIELLKLSSLASLITLTDLTFAAEIYIQGHGNATPVYLITLLIYFLLAMPFVGIARLLEHRVHPHLATRSA